MEGFTKIRVTASGKISTSRVWVGEVILTDNGNGNADITLYDGENDNEPVLCTIRAIQNETKVVNFTPYLVTERGLYIKVGSNVNEALIFYAESGRE
jgi:hypothetical protein